MNWKNRITNYNFWISIVSAVLLILQALNVEFDIAYISEIATAVLGLLVVIGIVSDPTKTYTKENSSKQEVAKKDNENLQNVGEEKQEYLNKNEDEIVSLDKEDSSVENLKISDETKEENVATPIDSQNEDSVLLSQIDLQTAIKKLAEISKLTLENNHSEILHNEKEDSKEDFENGVKNIEEIKSEIQPEEKELHFNIVNN